MGFFDSIGDRYRKWQDERKAKAAEKQHRKRNSASQQQAPQAQHEHITPAGPVSTRDRSASSPHVSHSYTPHAHSNGHALPPLDESVHYQPQLHIEHPASPFAPQPSAHRSPHSASPSSSSSSSQVAARNTGGPRAAAATQLRSASPTNVSSQLSTPYRAHPSGLASVGLGSSPISHSGAVGSHSSMNQGLSAHATPHRPLPSGASSSAGPSSQQRSSHPRYAESKEDDIGELDEELDHLQVSRRGPPTVSPASASNDSAQPAATKPDDDEQFAIMLQQQEYMNFLEESGELNARDADTLHAIEAARRAKEERRQRRRERKAAEQQAAAAAGANGNVALGAASVHVDVPHTPSPALEEDERQFFASLQSRAQAALEQQQQQQRHRPHASTSADVSSSERLLRSMGFISASPSATNAGAADQSSLRLPQISSGSSSSSSSANAAALARNRSYSHAQPAPSHLPSFPSLIPHSHSQSHSLNPSSAFLSRSASLSNASTAPASTPLTRAASLSRAEISALPTFHYVPSPSKSQTKVTQDTSLQITTTDNGTVAETVTSNVTAVVSVPGSPEEECCSICLGEFEFNEKLRALPCLHKYHAACVDDWLSRSSHCPNCNTDVRAAFG